MLIYLEKETVGISDFPWKSHETYYTLFASEKFFIHLKKIFLTARVINYQGNKTGFPYFDLV